MNYLFIYLFIHYVWAR